MTSALSIPGRKIIILLALSWLLLLGSSVLQDLVIVVTGTNERIWLLDVDSEDSVYTWFSTILLSGSALAALAIASHGHEVHQWRIIGVLFLALSADEMLSLHEKLSQVLNSSLSTSGPFLFAWVIPAVLLILVGALLFLPFILRLPRKVAAMILVASLLFIGGAIGLEMAAGAFLSGEEELTSALQTPRYRIMTNLEEGLEGLGVIVFIAALLVRCAQIFPSTFSMD